MASLEDPVRSAVPGGSVGKPLLLALLALLASGALFRGGGAGAAAPQGPSRPPQALVVCSEDWADCSTNCKRADWGMWPIPGLAQAKISRSRPDNSAQRLALTLSRHSLSGPASRKKSLPDNCLRFSWCCGQAHPCRPTADISGAIRNKVKSVLGQVRRSAMRLAATNERSHRGSSPPLDVPRRHRDWHGCDTRPDRVGFRH